MQKRIVQYLTTHYGPGNQTNYRRAPIPATLMPVNPYASEARLEAERKRQQGLIPSARPETK